MLYADKLDRMIIVKCLSRKYVYELKKLFYDIPMIYE